MVKGMREREHAEEKEEGGRTGKAEKENEGGKRMGGSEAA